MGRSREAEEAQRNLARAHEFEVDASHDVLQAAREVLDSVEPVDGNVAAMRASYKVLVSTAELNALRDAVKTWRSRRDASRDAAYLVKLLTQQGDDR